MKLKISNLIKSRSKSAARTKDTPPERDALFAAYTQGVSDAQRALSNSAYTYADACAYSYAADAAYAEAASQRIVDDTKLVGSGKPPIGLKPKWLCDEQRISEIIEAMARYKSANMPIPAEWDKELESLTLKK